ncbi:glycine betaine/L-proline ABC transporter substrate-binding protein ProX [Paraburkholderia sp. Ac-20342]|nr:glycine betaine/L-proline ABC transporter substrate-binding protein ProX [Paraburkholderia sp. Ac-20342]MBN3846215.1 glycine betaine/L-proline ABC transporter substrate-binding protein ProX [Paraburkholderia sp. Ac-20342]NIF55498.1 glycine betaine/L-proline ABC transporter substrate-binding protein ProX [Burkholderia sp. Ax-1724]
MNHSKGRRQFLIQGAILTASSWGGQKLFAAELPGTGVTVRPTGLTTPTARFQSVIVEMGLQQLGYTVKDYAPADPAIFHVAVAQGDADFCAQEWTPLYESYYQKVGGDTSCVRIGRTVTNCVFGYCIDRKTADKYQINNLGQLKDPKLARLFNATGADGKATLVAGNPGWGAARVIQHHIEYYGLGATVSPTFGNYDALMADVMTRYKAGEPVLYYTWVPMWVSSVLQPGRDVVWLSVPSPDPANGNNNSRLPDGRDTGFPIYEMKVLANREFVQKNPAAKKWFELVTIPAADISAENLLMQQGQNKIEDIRGHAKHWIAQNQKLFDSWIQQSIAAAHA